MNCPGILAKVLAGNTAREVVAVEDIIGQIISFMLEYKRL